MVDVGAEVLEGSFDAEFGGFELTVVTERCLLVNLDLWSVTHGIEPPPIEAR